MEISIANKIQQLEDTRTKLSEALLSSGESASYNNYNREGSSRTRRDNGDISSSNSKKSPQTKKSYWLHSIWRARQTNGGSGFENHLTKNRGRLHGKYLKMKYELDSDRLTLRILMKLCLESSKQGRYVITNESSRD